MEVLARDHRLFDTSVCDFLNVVHTSRPGHSVLSPLAFAQLGDVMQISQISLCGFDEKQQETILYKKYDTKILNAPDWVYREQLESGSEVLICFWKDGEIIWDETDIQNMTALSHFIILYNNHVRFMQDAVDASIHDSSSGLINLTGFCNAVQNLIGLRVAHLYSVLHISSSQFHLINRKYGYETGNRIMLQTFRQLKQFTQEQLGEQVIARLANDNLAVVVHNRNLEAYLEHLQQTELQFLSLHERVSQNADFRIGVYRMKQDENSPQLPMEYAMMANSRAQLSGINSVVYYTDELHAQFMREKEIESRMNDALTQHDFVVYYQPKVDLKSSRMVGSEALVRWKLEDKLISPNEFVPVLEKNGFITRLDFYVLETVCRDIRRWLEAGYDVVKTSVNFSRVHLSDMTFTRRIIRTLRDYRIPAKYIEIEFTETAEESDSAKLQRALRDLKDYGIETAMDDFGTGYSSLSLLTSLPFDFLKIDKSFFDNTSQSDREYLIVNNIIRMVQDLDIRVIMEGVETPEQVQFLRDANCDMAQGFFFDSPLPVEAFEKRLQNKEYA